MDSRGAGGRWLDEVPSCFGRVAYRLVRFAEERLVRHLRRRSQRPYRPPEGTSLYQHVYALGLMAPK